MYLNYIIAVELLILKYIEHYFTLKIELCVQL